MSKFFAIVLPGALVTFLFADSVGPTLLGDGRYQDMHGTARGLVFAFASYLAGHFVFLASALLLDELVYDRVRRATRFGEIRHLAKEGKQRPSSRLSRLVAKMAAAGSADSAVRQAEILKELDLGRVGAAGSMNSFQWAKARLALDHPEASLVVQRFEADSKFFRSLVVVLAGSAFAGAIVQHRYGLMWGLLLAAAAFVRYVDQRVKATRQAYWFMIAIAADAAVGRSHLPASGDAEYTHAGGVVYRHTRNGGNSRRSGAVQFLLVRPTSRDVDEWVLPKGHIEPAEKPAETAVREVLEEAGVLARIDQRLPTVQFPDGDDQATVAFYLMEFATKRRSTEAAHREPSWFDAQVAIEQATHQESKDLLAQASDALSQRSHVSDASDK